MNDFKITPIEQEGQRVLTTAQLAEAYGTDSKVITKNFNRNITRYIESKHFYCLKGDALREFKTAKRQIDVLPNCNTARKMCKSSLVCKKQNAELKPFST